MTEVQLQIAFIASEVDLSIGDCVFDRAFTFVCVGTVGKLTLGNVGPELDEVAFHLCGLDTPEFKLPQAGRIDDVPPLLESDEFGSRGCMFALEGPVGNLTNSQIQARLDSIQERTLADPTLAREGGCSATEQFFQSADAPLICGRGEDRLVAELAIEADHPLKLAHIDKIGFVEHDDGSDAPLLG